MLHQSCKDKKIVVLVTAIGTNASTTIISQLRKTGSYYIIGSDALGANLVVTSKDVDEFYVFPPACCESEHYISFLVDFCKYHKVDFFFSTIDEEVIELSSHRSQFEAIGVKLCIPNHEFVIICHYKDKLSDWIDTNIPEIGMKRYKRFKDVIDYPIFLKPIEGRGSNGCRKIESEEEAFALLQDGLIEDEHIIQDFYTGSIIAVDLIRNAETKQKQSIQRIEHVRNKSGVGIAVEIIDNQKLKDICNDVMEKLNLNGIANLEVFYKNVNGKDVFKIIEINPRFSAGISFTCTIGCDIVTAALRIASGEAYDFCDFKVGVHLARRYETYCMD